jgi:hypothetical protein
MVRSVVGNLLETRRLATTILAFGLLAMSARRVTDPDVWWHLRTGQLIVQNHRVFHADPFSFTRFGQPWINHEWLSDVLIFALYRGAGWGGLIVGFAVVITGAFLLLFLRCPGRPYLAAFMTAWGAVASCSLWGVRPQMLSLFLTSVFLIILERADERPSLLWFTPPLMLLWVNLHAGFPVGLGLMALFAAGKLLKLPFAPRARTEVYPELRRLLLFLVLCLAIVPLNPYGARMFLYPLATLRSPAIQDYVEEWRSPDFHQIILLPVLLMILAMMAAVAWSPRRLSGTEILLLLVSAGAALLSVRHIPIFVLAAVPILSAQIQAWWRARHTPGEAQNLFKLADPAASWVNGVVMVSFLALSIVWIHSIIARQSATESQTFPEAAVSFVETAGPPGPILNHYNWGGYFIWKLYPKYQVYIDGRTDLYADSIMEDDQVLCSLSSPFWQQLLDRWKIRTVILPPDTPLVVALRQNIGWKLIYADPQAVILTRRGDRPATP